MPCDSIILNRVNLSVADLDLLRSALEKLGAQRIEITCSNNSASFWLNGFGYSLERGQLVSRDSRVGKVADQVKRAYSKEVVVSAAKRFGWMEQSADATHTTLIKRY